ncbi:Hsp33 family molecular chaperone HslO [Longirhabdus pacifica]|uniref:Hsp33 family molecular chaperone HslO n=1 Tax=Longirhabdus pacifica TaxID=2305227 RepID=UPI001008E177|nr:Hsp33 family molecular chaperone HslO [Longirhabdus pacifica]
MENYIVRGTAFDGKVRVFAAESTSFVEEIRERQQTLPTATAAVGRASTIGAMMGTMLKGEQHLTIQIKGNGPIGQIVVDANAKGQAKAFLHNPQVDLPLNEIGKLDVRGAVGTQGNLYVTKDLGMKEPYRGASPIVSGEIGQDFTYYFAKSEQIPSAVAAGVLVDRDQSVKAAGGFIIQILPGMKDEDIAAIETEINQLQTVTAYLDDGMKIEELVKKVLPSFNIMDQIPLSFHCGCSKERMEKALISLGEKEINGLIEQGHAEVVCHFCNDNYTFSKDELSELLKQATS